MLRSVLHLNMYFARRYPWRTALIYVALIFAGLAEGFGIVTLLPALDLVLNQGGDQNAISQAMSRALGTVGLPATLPVLLTLIVVGISAKAGLTLLAAKFVGDTVANITTDLRLALLGGIMKARWAYFTSERHGRFGNAVSTEAPRSAQAFHGSCQVFTSILHIIVLTALALVVSWRVALGAIAAGVLLVAGMSWFIKLARRSGRAQTTLSNSVLARLAESLGGIKPLKAMAQEHLLAPMLESDIRGINRALRQQVLSREAIAILPEPLITLFLCVGLFFSVTLLDESFASLAVTAVLFQRVVARVARALGAWHSVVLNVSAFQSIRSMIRQAEAQAEPPSGSRAPSFAEAIEFRDVHFAHGERPVLHGVSLRIPPRRITAVVGPSGAGKTTIIDLIVGLYRPRQGEIAIDGVSLAEIDLRSWRQRVGYVPQDIFLFNDSIFLNITLNDPALSRTDAENALRAAGAWPFIEELPSGIDTPVGERGSMLSGGQRQRIAIARALVRRPLVLILDEATSALDPATEQGILETLKELSRDVTIVAISHNPAVLRVADAVYELHDGRAEPQQGAVRERASA